MAIKSQADQRRGQVMRDQHGREWFANIEKASGFPTGLVVAHFAVPHPELMPPQHYLVFSTEHPSHLRINYEQWIDDLDRRGQEWEAEKIRMGVFTQNPHELRILLGPKPMSSLPVRAMQQGNLWALGLSAVKPPEASKFFPDPEVAPDALVFSGPVFSDTPAAQPAAAPTAATALSGALAEIEGRCPPELKGAARSNWILAEMRKLTEAATAAAPQPQGV